MAAPTTSATRPTPAGGGQPTFSGFALRLFLYLFLVSLLFSLGGMHRALLPVQRWMAWFAASGARALGAGASVSETIVRTDHAALDINHECTGIFVLLVYTMFVLAYPAPWRQRVLGSLVGWVTLLGINLARLVILTVIASQKPDWFAYFHEIFFQGLFIGILAILATIWTEQVRRATLPRLSA
jgi:exosortase/archaeosortase family protein